MIVSLRGKLLKKSPAEVIVECGGLGYLCHISTNTYDTLPIPGEEVTLLTYLQVGENIQALFAFAHETERELFKMLIGVSGIGPKTAIVLLSSVTPDEFKRRLIAGEVAMLTALPGIGPKTARRIIVELKGKFVKLSKDELPMEGDEADPEVSDAYDALTALGFQIKNIRNAITKIRDGKDNLSTEEIIKKALTELR